MRNNFDYNLRTRETLNRCPRGTGFKQQKLPAWQPIISVRTVLPLIAAISIIFIPTGVVLLITSYSVQEVSVEYTGDRCRPIDGAIKYKFHTCDDFIREHPGIRCPCTVNFQLAQSAKGQVYMYYALTNFYQNHRRYVKSRDAQQLRGHVVEYQRLSVHCEPYRGDANKSFAYAPCGAIANSLFNDTVLLFYDDEMGSKSIKLINVGIAWNSDKEKLFRNPVDPEAWSKTVPPPNWHVPITQLDESNPENNGYQNEDLMVWMRTAAFPNFRKLYRIVDHSEEPFKDGLPAGTYTLSIGYAFPVVDFGGSKSIVLTTMTWLGGRNDFLGIAYLVVGSLFGLTSIVFVIIHLRYGNRSRLMLASEIFTDEVPYDEDDGRIPHQETHL